MERPSAARSRAELFEAIRRDHRWGVSFRGLSKRYDTASSENPTPAVGSDARVQFGLECPHDVGTPSATHDCQRLPLERVIRIEALVTKQQPSAPGLRLAASR